MSFQLPFEVRIPLSIMMKEGIIYLKIQYDVIQSETTRAGYYNKYFKIESSKSVLEIGKLAYDMLQAYQQHPEWTKEAVIVETGMTWEEYYAKRSEESRRNLGWKDDKDFQLNYIHIIIEYTLATNQYSIHLCWPHFKGRGYWMDFSPASGEPGILTFPDNFEFDDTIAPEELGRMILEALDRSRRVAEAAAGNHYPSKELTLLDESVLTVQMPRDKHFVDAEDLGVAEIYQAYEYISREGAASAACFYVGIGAEIDCCLEAEHIKTVWEDLYGKAELLQVEKGTFGLFTLRVELKNKKMHRISYFLQQEEDLLLECAMELSQPEKRKKLADALPELFEKFARECKKKL